MKSKNKKNTKQPEKETPREETGEEQSGQEKIIKKTLKRLRGKEPKETIGEKLKEIYEEGGKIPDMSRLERRRKRWWLVSIFILLFLSSIAAAVYAGWVFWKPWEKPQSQGLNLEILGPTQVVNGEPIIYNIKYQNLDDVPMANLEIQANLPQELVVLELTPEPTKQNNTWSLGSLSPGQDGEIKLKIYFQGEIKNSLNLQALATYRPANFSSDFQEIETLSVFAKESLVDLEASGPSKAIPGEDVEYEVKFKNTSEYEYTDMEIQAVYPDSFIYISSEPAPLGEAQSSDVPQATNRWIFEKFATDTEEIIKIRGNFSSQGQGLQNLTFKVGFNKNNHFNLQKEKTTQTEVLAGDLVLHLFINGSETNQNINFGENLRFSLTYDNTSGEEMENVELKVHVESDLVDSGELVNWDALNLPDDLPAQVSGETIVWSKDSLESLEKIEKNAEGVIDFSMPVVSAPLSSLDGAYEINIWAEARVDKIGDMAAGREIQTTPVTFAVNTDLDFQTIGRYFNEDGEALGFGPLPPRVGETTGYHIFWTITNSLHEIQNIRVTTELPQDVAWTGRTDVSAGDLEYNEETRLVTWLINRLPTSIKDITVSFEVSVKPDEDDLGTFVNLTTQNNIEAQDQKTGDTLLLSREPILTDLPFDDLAKGKGVVVESEE
ncbi:hypothetical protein KJ969_03340 [Patescibacteria group bacterium]|nr:hypothetical protein [Patescibacteria group bacterium]MBU1922408.1 hypothetical protein [Patescibacteria group bacterium]